MKTSQEFINEINNFLIEEFEIEGSIAPDMSITEALDLDSLDLIDLVVVIEEQFGVKIEGEDFAFLKTMDDFYNHIYSQKAA